MYHSIIFEDEINRSYIPTENDTYDGAPITTANYDAWRKSIFHTLDVFEEWQLVSETRPVINPPGLKTIYEDIPGADGGIDYTDTLTGYPLFNTISGNFVFYVLNDYDQYEWNSVYSAIKRRLHGQRKRVFLEDDPEHYWTGRITVEGWSSSDKHYSKVTIGYHLDPYRYCLTRADEDWLWDPFNFLTGIVPDKANGGLGFRDIVMPVGIPISINDIPLHVEGPVIPDIIYTPKVKGNFIRIDWRNTDLSLGPLYQNSQFKQIEWIPSQDPNVPITKAFTDVIFSNIRGLMGTEGPDSPETCYLNINGYRLKVDENGNAGKYKYDPETGDFIKDEHGELIPDENGKTYEMNHDMEQDPESYPEGYGTVTIRFRKKVL